MDRDDDAGRRLYAAARRSTLFHITAGGGSALDPWETPERRLALVSRLAMAARRYVRGSMDPDAIPLAEEDYLYTALSGLPDAGQGLFTAITIYADEVIAIFHGERLSAKAAGDRAAQGLDRYFMELPDGTTLDAMGVEGFAKFANDAKGGTGSALRNNAVITLDDDDRVCIRATRRIQAGKEVLCGYGKRYWQRHGAERLRK